MIYPGAAVFIYTHCLIHWGRVTHICVGNLTIIGPDNGLSPSRRQAIIWTNAGILLIGPWGTNFNEILIGIHTFSFKKIHLKMSFAKWRPFCLGLNELMWEWCARVCYCMVNFLQNSHDKHTIAHLSNTVNVCLFVRNTVGVFHLFLLLCVKPTVLCNKIQ